MTNLSFFEEEKDMQVEKWQKIIFILTGLLLIVLGVSVIFGWHYNYPLLTNLYPSFIAMQYNTAICFIVTGIAFIHLSLKQFLIAKVANAFVMLISLLVMIEYLFKIDLGIDEFLFKPAFYFIFPGRMGFNTAIGFFLANLALWEIDSVNLSYRGNLVQKFASIIIIALSVVAILSYLTGLQPIFQSIVFIRMALHTAFGLLLIGCVIFINNVWLAKTPPSKIWDFPILIFLGISIITVILWVALKYQENMYIKNLSTIEIQYLKSAIDSKINYYILALARLADRWNIKEGYPYVLWEKDTRHYLKDHPGLKQVRWVDNNLINRWTQPPNPSLDGKVIQFTPEDEGSLQEAKEKKQTIIETSPSDNNHQNLIFFTPLYHDKVFDGWLISDFDLYPLFNEGLAKEVFQSYFIYIFDKNTVIYTNAPQFPDFFPQENIEFHAKKHLLNWIIEIFPKPETFFRYETPLPLIILFSGLLIASLASAASFLFQQYRKSLKELEIANENANQANQAKSLFLANMSHEIRTPLNSIIGTISLLNEMNLDAKMKKYIERIQLSGKLLLNLINNILDFSKIEAGELILEKTPCDFQLIVKELVDSFLPKAQAKKLELFVWYDVNKPIKMMSDPLRLKQIASNLISNAIKFTEKGYVQIKITYKEVNQQAIARLEIEDSGVGINPHHFKRLFQKFSQADLSTTRKYGGTGLGLVIAKQLVYLFGGTIGFNSEEHKGSTFWFEIPFEIDKQAEEIQERKFDLIKQELAGRSVLTIMNESRYLKILKDYIQKADMVFQTYSSAQQALDEIKQSINNESPFGIVLIDFQLPDMNGIALAKEIHHLNMTPSPILILLLDSQTQDLIDPLLINGCVNKPIFPFDLYETIINALKRNKP